MRTARELERGKPYKDGNLGIECQRPGIYGGEADEVEFKESPWGVPAAALLAAITSQCEHPQNWMLLDRPRELLIAMEDWYNRKVPEERYTLPEDAWEWKELRRLEKTKWSQAFELCGGGENGVCSRCQDRTTKMTKVKLEPMSV
ncbi:hypothetical protein N7466_002888 [Penicillium verhagenii]|uniref:uncharacterized protein n=1 Tax=Penicillium verhagenii TaxID=1562060 RepID=UPI002545715B|nr:uncharacterized protein N7466_002888 [Penicillium verhagenii]KAJ5939754.1 hypothetical protein N7466_002888 [Penicillium verhagenii]